MANFRLGHVAAVEDCSQEQNQMPAFRFRPSAGVASGLQCHQFSVNAAQPIRQYAGQALE